MRVERRAAAVSETDDCRAAIADFSLRSRFPTPSFPLSNPVIPALYYPVIPAKAGIQTNSAKIAYPKSSAN